MEVYRWGNMNLEAANVFFGLCGMVRPEVARRTS